MEYRRIISITSRLSYMSALASFCMSVLFYSVGFADVPTCQDAKDSVDNSCKSDPTFREASRKVRRNSHGANNYEEINSLTTRCFQSLKYCVDKCGENKRQFNMDNLESFIASLQSEAITTNKDVNYCLKKAKKFAYYKVNNIYEAQENGQNESLGACSRVPENAKYTDQEITFTTRCKTFKSFSSAELKVASTNSFSIANVGGESLEPGSCSAKSKSDPTAQWLWNENTGSCVITRCKENFKFSSDGSQCVDFFTPNPPKEPIRETDENCSGLTRWDQKLKECVCPAAIPGCSKSPKPKDEQKCNTRIKSGEKLKWENNNCVPNTPKNPTCNHPKVYDTKLGCHDPNICTNPDLTPEELRSCHGEKPPPEKEKPEDPKDKKDCLDRINDGEELEWDGKSCVKSREQAGPTPDDPKEKEALTKDDVNKLTKAMENAASNMSGNNGGGGLNVGNTSVGGNNSDFGSSSYDGSNSDSGDSRNSSGGGLISSPQKITALPRGPQPFLGYKKKESGGNAAQGNPGGLGGNPGLGGGGRGRGVKPQKVKGAGRRGRSRLWEAAKQLVSGSFFGGGGAESGGGNSPFQKTSKQKRFLSDGQGGYVDTKGMTQSELNSLNDSFRNNIPGYKPAPATSGLLGDQYNQLVTTILKNETMLNRYGCEPPLTTCEAVKRMTASTKKSRRKPSSVKSKRKRKKKRSRKRRKKRRK